MYLTLKNIYNFQGELPYILNIFKTEVYDNFDNKKIKNIQKKLVTIYNDDIIPKDFKKIILTNID
jgi:hypothetical protein